MGPKGLSQLERLCEKFQLRCHWCRKECSYSSKELTPRRDWLADFQRGKNAFSNLVLSCSACFWRRHPETAPKMSAPKLQRSRKPYKRKIYPFSERPFIERLVWLKTRGVCFYCKTPVSYRFPDVAPMIKDHYIPLFHNGADDHSNLVPACRFCDRHKGRTLPWSFKNRFDGSPMVCFPVNPEPPRVKEPTPKPVKKPDIQFAHHLPHCVGFVSTTGWVVMYGPEYARLKSEGRIT